MTGVGASRLMIGLSGLHWQDRLRNSELLFSFIPMRGEVIVGEGEPKMIFSVDVHQVWRGEVAPQETIVVAWPGAFPLAEEIIIAANREADGMIQTGSCSFTLPVHGSPKLDQKRAWFHETFGEPVSSFLPPLMEGSR